MKRVEKIRQNSESDYSMFSFRMTTSIQSLGGAQLRPGPGRAGPREDLRARAAGCAQLGEDAKPALRGVLGAAPGRPLQCVESKNSQISYCSRPPKGREGDRHEPPPQS